MDGNKTLVSIVMPAYNSEKYITEAINSVIAQTYEDWELIVLDDGSEDDTLQIINKCALKDPRIKAYSNKMNMGVAKTRNKGIDLAVGEWIAFLDSDDMWHPAKLEKQLKFANEKSAGFIFTGSSYINKKGEPFKKVFEVPPKSTYKGLRKQNVISCSSVLIKKKHFKEIKMERDDLHEDYIAWLKILKTGIIAYGINEPLLIYRIYKGSKSSNKRKSAIATYRVYRHIGINPISSVYFFIRYTLASVKKYRKIYKNSVKRMRI